ncbi:MAG: rod shape-determining protein RodA [Candidatus Omnitrophica bacterium]|nr:rod shape-determining protein RodA [Candidatus Omnitrophota bacterium]
MDKTGFKILVIVILISLFGILSIYSSTYQKEGKLWQEIYKRQVFWAVLGLAFFLLMANFNYRKIWEWTYILYGLSVGLLFLVFILGIVRLGAQRWLKFAWFNFQPTELVKLIIVIFLARYFSRKSPDNISANVSNLGIVRGFILPFIFVAVPAGLIVEQPDLGSGAMVLLIFISMIYLSNVKLRYLSLFFLLVAVLFPVFWHFLRDYQKDRLLVFLNPNVDPLGAGYTVMQSKIAIGSGGLFGRGWLSGTQSQLHFLPESHTDFIFATFTEGWGFAGGAVLIFLYYLLIRAGLAIGERTHDSFGKMLAFGISCALSLQVIINIAMNLGLAPIVGLPLPLMSYGGSSLIITFAALGILANISKSRT